MFRKGDDIFDPVVASNAMNKLVGEGAGSEEEPGIHAGSCEVDGEGKESGASKVPPTETKDSKEEGGTTADAPKGSSDKGEVGGPGIDAGPSTVGKDEAAVEEKDTPAPPAPPAPPIEEKDPMVEDTPAVEGTGRRGRAVPCPK